MTGERIVCLTSGRPRPRTQLQRTVGVFLAVLLVSQAITSRPAMAEEPAKNAHATRPLVGADQFDSPAAEARKRGTIALNTGHYSDAIRAFEEAYSLDQDPDILLGLAQSYRLAGRPSKALEACSSFLRTATPNATDRLQAERFMAEVAMIVYQLQLHRESAPSTEAAPMPVATGDTSETPKTKEPRLDLTPRPIISPSDSLVASPTPAAPTEKHFYQSTTFLIVAGAVIVVGAGLGYWAYERSRSLPSPTTSLGYQTAFP